MGYPNFVFVLLVLYSYKYVYDRKGDVGSYKSGRFSYITNIDIN